MNLYVCPDCGGTAVDYSALVGGEASCRVCSWRGPKDELLSVPVQGKSEQMFIELRNDFRKAIAGISKEMVPFLAKWGFIDTALDKATVTVTDPKQVLRYMNRVAQAALTAIFDEREKIEEEKVRGARAGN